MGPINAAFNMKGYFAAENLWEKIVSAHKLSGGGPFVRGRKRGGEGFEVVWLGGRGRVISSEGWGMGGWDRNNQGILVDRCCPAVLFLDVIDNFLALKASVVVVILSTFGHCSLILHTMPF